ncbi:ATP-binding cassette domain-containing protein [Yinghuangia seranimata]|uniref:ATP-binding cassette domain-containing protein n=1 Tax=Yinghuangia seranimata TaxID=408067 RepID=UPI00248CB4FF|nr:ATP-binding cassette domain-containing protein [Yinghuangia seranimata]MDI2127290.1 ATP-binding cassette domain-containing protein [Yinghuangia seranimata]
MPARGVGIVAEGVTVRGLEGTVVADVDLDARPGSFTVLSGPAGSGRTALLLALGARFRTARGTITVDGTPLPRGAKAARRRISVARAAPAIELEERLTVAELVGERRAIGGPHVTDTSVADAFDLVDLACPPHTLAGRLPHVEKLLLALALATAEESGGVLVDDVDSGIAGTDLDRAWHAVRAVARTGRTVIATATAPPGGSLRPDLGLALPGHHTHLPATRPGGRR